MSVAGLMSHKLGNTLEPPLQKKKPVSHTPDTIVLGLDPDVDVRMEPPLQRRRKPTSELTSKARQVADEYILLGDQSKFASNVKYRTKVARPLRQEEPRETADRNGRGDMSPPPAPRSRSQPQTPLAPRQSSEHAPPKRPQHPVYKATNGHASKLKHASRERHRSPPPPAPKVIVDTGSPLKSRKVKNTDASEPAGIERFHSPPPAPKAVANTGSPVKSTRFKGEQMKKPFVPKIDVGSDRPVEKSRRKDTSGEKKNGRHHKSADYVHEFVQTDIDRGRLDSGQEAPDNYALKYRAGLTAPRNQGPKRLSEYQKAFAWKKGDLASPLLAAEQVVYKSCPQMSPPKAARMNISSEYQRQFQPWNKLMQSMPEVATNGRDDAVMPSKKSKMRKRSKSVEAVRRAPAGVERVTSDNDKRLVRETVNPHKSHFPLGRPLSCTSEYSCNFQPPWKFEVKEGTWKGASPPHVTTKTAYDQDAPLPSEDRTRVSGDMSSSVASSWYSEVLELRRRAEEYKKRAQGTHFLRSHLGQLYAKQAELWDTTSSSSVLSALSLESPHTAVDKRPQKERVSSHHRSAPADYVRKKLAWTESLDDGTSLESDVHSSATSCETNSAALDNGSDAASSDTLRAGSVDDLEGRVPTPILSNGDRRHHLDRTTPSVGGLLLSSPFRSKSPSSGRPRQQTGPKSPPPEDSGSYREARKTSEGQMNGLVSRTNANNSHNLTRSHRTRDTASREYVDTSPPKANGRPVSPAPIYGKPTPDDQVLIDETAKVDRPLLTEYVSSPPQVKMGKKVPIRERFPHANIPSTIREDLGGTAPSPPHTMGNWLEVNRDDIPPRDDDMLSISARSVASSCSLASETLERARNRRDEFWGRPQARPCLG